MDEGFFAPYGGKLKMQISFVFPSRFPLESSLSIEEMSEISREASVSFFSESKLIKNSI